MKDKKIFRQPTQFDKRDVIVSITRNDFLNEVDIHLDTNANSYKCTIIPL